MSSSRCSFWASLLAVCAATLLALAGCASLPAERDAARSALTPEVGERPFLAVLPLQNLSATIAPLAEIRAELIEALAEAGCDAVGDKELELFMAHQRLRNVGGINGPLAIKLGVATGAQAVLITTLELYAEQYPPRIALLSRLVSLEEDPEILWMDSVALAGDETPGLLGLGLIRDPAFLRQKALTRLAASLADRLAGFELPARVPGKFRPRLAYGTQHLEREGKSRVVVAPFFNHSDRKYGGEIVALHFLAALHRTGRFALAEPGVVHADLLRYRVIMEEGVSLSQAELLFATLKTDFIFSGKLFDYQDPKEGRGTPVVDFSATMLAQEDQGVVWISKSYNAGTDGVYFFDWGRHATAGAMAAAMTRAVAGLLAR